MRVKQVERYLFSELDDDGKERARESYRRSFDFQLHAECTIEEWEERLTAEGWSVPKYGTLTIYYSGFWSQGDGAHFISDSVDLERLARAMVDSGELDDDDAIMVQRLLVYDVLGEFSANFRTIGRYSHEGSVYAELNGYTGRELVDLAVAQFADLLDEFRRDRCREIYRALETEYEYQTSDEVIDEWLSESGNEYDENGGEI